MKTALVFPGQGSQFVGMGKDFYSKYESSRLVLDSLNDVLNKKMSEIIFSGDEKELSHTENSQPAIMSVSIAIFRALIEENLIKKNTFECVAGHSLGEYSALVANDCLDFRDSVSLLKIRSKAMQESMPVGTGGMIALIGCTEEIVIQCISDAKKYGRIYIANDNANGQIVLSGELKAIDYIKNNSKKFNIRRLVKLPVSAPFHCELMEGAKKTLEKEIYKYKFNPFSVPMYSNVTATVCENKEIVELLLSQITAKVRWREIIENMIHDGVKNFIEIGPGNVLVNLIKRISKDANTISICKIEDLEKLSEVNL